MAIEGPLRELGIHDVFQLIDLSRKTGLLRVSSTLRGDECLVSFDRGRVVQATVRGENTPAATARVSMTIATSKKERERQLRTQIENAVFEVIAWTEGFVSFEECSPDDLPPDAHPGVSTASLLMEGSRRIDEWSRIAAVVPGVNAIAELAPVDGEGDHAPMLDLLPHEWQVLTMIDGERDIRAIASALARDEFETAKIIYGLATTGIVVIRMSVRSSTKVGANAVDSRLVAAYLDAALAAARSGDFAAARASCEQVLRLAPADGAALRAREALDALAQLERVLEAPVHV